MERTSIGKAGVENYDLLDIDVYPQLKSLYLGHNSWLRNERIIMFASIFPNLQHLDLRWCHRINEGICQVLRRCCKLKHLNLAYCIKVKLHGMNFEVPKLKVLNLSNTSVDDETLYVILKNCCGLLQLFLYNCDNVTQKGVKLVVEKCTQLRKIYKFEHFLALFTMNVKHTKVGIHVLRDDFCSDWSFSCAAVIHIASRFVLLQVWTFGDDSFAVRVLCFCSDCTSVVVFSVSRSCLCESGF
ncbi:hypothetical protein MTR_6g016760 [Medicago truncatula]|uniref:F-box/LRR-repeat protein 15-like leucin rich repeat domain-containing protein n=1 Tax=Medicago truncatula TaxID=3880 RepID=A0A072U6F2_MEDTR|nr:hypothetical protein MTR_6g016760 [Medicago truncatula]